MDKVTNGAGNSAVPLQKRLEEPEVVAAINRLLDRIDALENTVDALNRAVKEGPALAAIATDAVDEAMQRAANNGVSVEERVQNALVIAEKVTDKPAVDTLSKAMDLAKEAPGLVAMMADMFDDTVRNAAQSGIDVEARVKSTLQLAVQLTEPKTMNALQSALMMAAEAPEFMAMVADMFDAHVHRVSNEGIDIEARIKGLLSLIGKVTDPGTTKALESVLGKEAVQIVGALGNALAQSDLQSIEPVGPMGMLKKLRDPDTQRALGFATSFAKALGKELK